jgi:GNAT superfamily N-acetyltransferase
MHQATMTFRIEQATERDLPLILRFIKELAHYEKLLPHVTATEATLRGSLFGPRPAAEVVIGYAGEEPAGFAVFFQTFSTFLGVRGMYLEDLFVAPRFRRHGLGRQLLTHLARLAVERGCGRLEWAVLDWNELAIRFYKSLGARAMDEWTVFLHVVPPPGNFAVGADEICRAGDPHVGAAVPRFLLPYAVLFGDRVIRIGQEREGESVLTREARLARFIQDADAENRGPARFESRQVVAEIAGFFRAPGRIVLRVEVQNDGPPFVLR